MTRKNIFTTCVFVLLLITSIPAYSSNQIIMHLGCVQPKDHIINMAGEKFAELVEEKTNGEIKIITHPNGEVCDGDECIEMMQAGTIDFAIVNTVKFDNYSKQLTPLSFPFLLPDKDSAVAFREEIIKPNRFSKFQEELGVVPLDFYSCGWRNLFAKEPINTIEDLVGKKKRVMGTPYHIDAMKFLGLNPCPLAWGEVYTALQLGTVDLVGNEIATYVKAKFYEVAPYFIKTQHSHTFMLLGMSEQIFNSFDLEKQNIFKESAVEALNYWWDRLDEYEEASYEALRKLDGFGDSVHLIVFSEEELNKMTNKVLPPMLSKYKDDLGQDAVDWLNKNVLTK